jgi:predicted negative regulator of RcsB-dependent stress response
MADYRTEEEQIELIKKWWNENGKAIVIGTLVSLVVFFGWTTWQSHQRARNESAADLYQQMLNASQLTENSEKVAGFAEQLRKEFPDTTYGVFAALQLAKDAVAASDLPRAASLLEWAIAQKPDPSLVPLIGFRLAQVQYAQGEFDKALASIPNIKDGDTWQVVFSELRGDIYRAQNKFDEARDSYNAALKNAGTSSDQEQRANIEIKLSGLPNPATSAPSAPEEVK